MVTGLLATAFTNFSNSCVPLLLPRRAQMQVIACAMEKMTLSEQWWEQAARKSFCHQEVHIRGLPGVLSPLPRFPPYLSCQMANQVCGLAPSNVQKPAVDMGIIVFPKFFCFQILTEETATLDCNAREPVWRKPGADVV